MAIKVAAVATTNNTSTGTQNLTSSGFGTPDAAIFVTTFSDAAAGTLDGQACFSMGFTDGTNECVAAVSDRNNQATSDSYRRQATDEVFMRLAPTTGNIRAEANFSSWVTDGVQVNWGVADSVAKHVMAILIQADHANAAFYAGQGSAGDGDGTAVNFTGLGAEADFVILASVQRDTADTGEANGFLSLGIWINDGTDTQHSVNWFTLDAKGTSEIQGFLDTSYACATGIVTSEGSGHDISAHASGFTVTTRERNSHNFGLTFNYLCGKWGDSGISQAVGTFQVPTLTGTAATTGVGFEPKYLFNIMSMLSSTDTWTTDQSACAVGFGFTDGTSEESMSISSEDAVGTTDCDSLYDQNFYSAAEGSSRTVQDASLSSFDSDGFTLNWATAPLSTAGSAVYWAISDIQIVRPGPTTATFSVPTATLDISLTVSPGVTTASFSVPTATVSLGAITITPGVTDATFTVPTATVSLGTLTVSAGVTDATFTVPAATVSLGALTVTPGVTTGTFTVPTATVVQSLTVRPGVTTATFSVPTATIAQDVVLTPGVTTATFTVPTASIVQASLQTIEPGPVTATFSVPSVLVTIKLYVPPARTILTTAGSEAPTLATAHAFRPTLTQPHSEKVLLSA